jgi:hypothetical protein
MRALLLVVFFLLIGYSHAQNWRWVDYLQGGGGNHAVYDVHVPEGVDDYAYAVGRYRVTTTFYGQDTNVVNPYQAGDRDVYIAKIDSNGNYIWVVTEGGPYSDYPNAVCTDEFGNVYIAGTFEQTAIFDATPIVGDVAGDVFVAKYNSDGVLQWVKPFSGPGWEFAQEIECDLNGNLFIGGYQTGSFNYEAGVLPEKGFFVMKMDYDGNVDWCVGPDNISTSANSWVWGMKYKDNKLYFSGSIKNTVKFGTYSLPGYAWEDCYIARLDMNGNFEDAWRFGGIYFDACQSIDVVGDTIYAAGSYAHNVMFDTIPMYAPIVGTGGAGAYDSRDAFLAKFLVDGTCLWVEDIKGDFIDETYTVILNKKGNPVITGSYGQIDIDASVGAYGEIYVREYDTDGNIKWTLQPDGGGLLGQGMSIDEDASGNYFFGGKIKGNHYFQDLLVVCPNVINHTAVMSRIYPPIDLIPDDTLQVCHQDTIWIPAPHHYGSPSIEQWVADPLKIISQNQDSIQVVIDGLDSVSYIVTNSHKTHIFAVDTFTVYFSEIAYPVSALQDSLATCESSLALNAGSDALYYNWTGIDVIYDSLFTVASSGTYQVQLNNSPLCITNDSVYVEFLNKPLVDLGADTAFCGVSIELNAGSDGKNYNWGGGFFQYDSLFTASASGQYIVEVEAANNCLNADTIQVTILDLPTINLGSDFSTCVTSVELNAGSDGEYYNWGGGFVQYDSLLTVNVSGTYSVIVQGLNLCESVSVVTVTLNSSPVVDLGPDISTCEISYILHAGTSGEYYDWGSGPVLYDSTHSVNVSGTYTVIIEDSYGCTASDNINVNLKDCSGIGEISGFGFSYFFSFENQSLTVTRLDESVQFILFDVSGKEVKSTRINSIDVLSLNEFESGIYFVSFYTDAGILIQSDRIFIK